MKFRHIGFIALFFLSCSKSHVEDLHANVPVERSSKKIQWQNWSPSIFETAKKENRLILIDLEAVWCHWCHVMEEDTYADPKIIALINSNFIPVKVDQDAYPDLSNRYNDYGWPATIVMNGDGKDITRQAGYIEPEVMKALLELMIKNPDDPSLLKSKDTPLSEAKSEFLTEVERKELQKEQRSFYDFKLGGWGQRHKYLDGKSIEYAITHSNNAEYKKMATQTLNAVQKIMDPAWGGVYQYSTDGDWIHPHFEKIMSIQTQAVKSYAYGYLIFKNQKYNLAAEKTARYMKSFLMSEDGAFYTSQDADLVQGQHAGEYFKLNKKQRINRGIPRVDQNIYARENGWAIESFVTLYAATGDDSKLNEAIKAAKWVIEHRMLKKGGFRHDDRDAGAYLGDSLAMGSALLQLYAATGDREWLKISERTADYLDEHFQNPDSKRAGYISSKNTFAGQTIAPDRDENMDLARYANLLFRYTGNAKYQKMAKQSMKYLLIPEVRDRFFTSGILLADEEISNEPAHITIVGAKTDAQSKALFKTALRLPNIYRRTEWKDPDEGRLPNPDVDYPKLDRPAAFVCTQKLCSSPIFSSIDLLKRMEKLK